MKPMNVLLIVSDNQRADTIGALGNDEIRTPNLDRLVRDGVAFNNAYFMGSMQGATCLPSRTMLLTGRNMFRIPHTELSEEAEAAHPATGIPSLPQTLKQHGFCSLRSGKQGNYPRFAAQEFDTNIVVARSVNGSERHADNAIQFLKNRNPDTPFFLYVAFGAPNDPHVGPGTAPREYMGMYPPGSVPVPPNYLPIHPFDNGEMIIRDELLAPWPRTREVIELHLAGYYSVITYMDAQIGRILDTLEEAGMADNTIVVFTSDTGTAIGSHGLMGMQNLYEHSTRVPLIISAPGIEGGQAIDALVYLYDLLPTICDLSGVPAPGDIDGKSLVPIMDGSEKAVRGSIFTAYRDVQRAVRDGRQKLIVYPKTEMLQLFDLIADPYEVNNLATEDSSGNAVSEMMKIMRQWQRELGDPVSL